MSVRTNGNYEEAEREGEAELVLVAIEYTGGRSVYNSDNIRTQGGYPALDGFQSGQTKLAKLPSNKLGWWERHADFELHYDEESMAEVLLGSNFIPSQILGPDFDPDVRDLVHDRLGLEPSHNEKGYRDQLLELVGRETEDEDEEEMSNTDQTRVEKLVTKERSVLITVANSYDAIDDYLDELDKAQVTHLTQNELAEFLVSQDSDTVDRRIDTVESGGEL